MNGGSILVQAAMFSLVVAAAQSATQFRRAKLNSDGTVQTAAATEKACGIFDADAVAGAKVSILDRKTAGLVRMVASKAIAAGAPVYGAASGKLTDSSGGGAALEGTAVTEATADGDVIYVLLAA